MNWNQAIFPSLKKEGWTRNQENGSLPKQRGRGGQFGELFRPEGSPKILPKGIKIAEEGPISRNTQIIMPGKSLSPAECILNGLPKRPAESNAEKLVCTHVQKSHRFMFHGIDKAYSIRVSKTDRPQTRHDLGVGQAIPLRRNLPRECLRPVESETGNNWRPARGTDLQTRMILWERRQRIREPA